MTDLHDRTILVTGASSGIGRAISERLLQLGARVIGLGRDFSAWPAETPGFTPLTVDLGSLADLPARLKVIARSHPDIDSVVCNAGSGRFGSLEEHSYHQIEESIALNLTQHIFFAKAFLPTLKRRGRGDLIFMGSESALQGGPGGTLYSATKFGLRGLAQSLRKDCASAGIRVCVINPGMVDTPFFTGLNFRPGKDPCQHLRPADIADTLVLVLGAPEGTVFDEINLSPLKKVIEFRKHET